MRVAQYIANFVADLGVRHVFGVSGGGSQWLNDAFGYHERLKYVANHHEQAAGMAADAYARLNGMGCVLVTTGPGGSNAITAVCCAWVDSIPVLFISGQVTRNTMLEGTGLRQNGVQETDTVSLVKSITKYAVCVKDEREIRFEMEKALWYARTGKPGPVWIEVPLDIQSKEVNPDELLAFHPYYGEQCLLTPLINRAVMLLEQAKRPILIVGNGARATDIRTLADTLKIPVITSWGAADLLGDHPFHIGHCGLFGDRAGNLAVQRADLVLSIGCRLSMAQTGYDRDAFAPKADIVMVDMDSAEIAKFDVAVGIPADAGVAVDALLDRKLPEGHVSWLGECLAWRDAYPVVLPEYAESEQINSYYFVQLLSRYLPNNATVVLDMGTAFTGTYQAAAMKQGQRWITAGGHAPMGYALPGAIGAAFATGRRVICIVGDGSFQFNVQELATIAHHQLPITIFYLDNGGYLTMKHSQRNNFGRMVGSDKADLSFPDLRKLADAYDLMHLDVIDTETMESSLEAIVNIKSPVIVQIHMAHDQPLIPRVQSQRLADGAMAQADLADMYPHLEIQ